MGNIFCGDNEEKKKQPAIQSIPYGHQSDAHYLSKNEPSSAAHQVAAAEMAHNNSQAEYLTPEKPGASAEDARRNYILQVAAREMISIKSSRGSAGYFDQGFAKALADHLEETTNFADSIPYCLPEPTDDLSKSAVSQRLSQPNDRDSSIAEATDDVESLLDATIPKKERLFAAAGPILDNLL
jgi:hypothetical protein